VDVLIGRVDPVVRPADADGRTVGTPRSATTGCIGPVAGMKGQRTGSPWSY